MKGVPFALNWPPFGTGVPPTVKSEVVTLGNGVSESDLIVHDEQAPAAYAFMLAQM